MGKKVTKLENLKGTFVFTIDSLIPFRKTDLEKIRNKNSCDNLEEISPNRIRVTQIVSNGSAEGNYSVDSFDKENNWGESIAQCMKTDIRKYLASIRPSLRNVRFHRTQIFLT